MLCSHLRVFPAFKQCRLSDSLISDRFCIDLCGSSLSQARAARLHMYLVQSRIALSGDKLDNQILHMKILSCAWRHISAEAVSGKTWLFKFGSLISVFSKIWCIYIYKYIFDCFPALQTQEFYAGDRATPNPLPTAWPNRSKVLCSHCGSLVKKKMEERLERYHQDDLIHFIHFSDINVPFTSQLKLENLSLCSLEVLVRHSRSIQNIRNFWQYLGSTCKHALLILCCISLISANFNFLMSVVFQFLVFCDL